jgi:hypothetical protein
MLHRVRPGSGRRTPIRIGAAIGLPVALGASARLITLPTPHTPGTDWRLAEAYPHAQVADMHGYVEAGRSYQPELFLDLHRSRAAAASCGGRPATATTSRGMSWISAA